MRPLLLLYLWKVYQTVSDADTIGISEARDASGIGKHIVARASRVQRSRVAITSDQLIILAGQIRFINGPLTVPHHTLNDAQQYLRAGFRRSKPRASCRICPQNGTVEKCAPLNKFRVLVSILLAR